MMDERLFEEVFAILDGRFPAAKNAPMKGRKGTFPRDAYHLSVRRDEAGRVIAFLASWEFEDFRFVEHLAVSRAAAAVLAESCWPNFSRGMNVRSSWR